MPPRDNKIVYRSLSVFVAIIYSEPKALMSSNEMAVPPEQNPNFLPNQS